MGLVEGGVRVCGAVTRGDRLERSPCQRPDHRPDRTPPGVRRRGFEQLLDAFATAGGRVWPKMAFPIDECCAYSPVMYALLGTGWRARAERTNGHSIQRSCLAAGYRSSLASEMWRGNVIRPNSTPVSRKMISSAPISSLPQ